MRICLNFDEQLLKRYEQRGASLIFDIAWEHEGVYYPSEDWIDFGSSILDFWLVETSQLKKGYPKSRFVFMDGPYAIKVKYNEEQDTVILRPEGLDVVWQLSFKELTALLISTANEVCQELKRVGVGAADQASLQKGIALLESLV